MMCKMPLLISTVDVDGKLRPFCPNCLDLIDKKTKQAMEKRGKKIKGKGLAFPAVG